MTWYDPETTPGISLTTHPFTFDLMVSVPFGFFLIRAHESFGAEPSANKLTKLRFWSTNTHAYPGTSAGFRNVKTFGFVVVGTAPIKKIPPGSVVERG